MMRNLLRSLFEVIKPMPLNGISRLMKPGERGFAYVPLTAPVEIEIEALPYMADRNTFEASIRWIGHV